MIQSADVLQRLLLLLCDAEVTHTPVLLPYWILGGTTQVSRHQKGKTNLDLLDSISMLRSTQVSYLMQQI